MELQALAEKHGGLSAAVVGKAKEYLRLLELKLQGGGQSIPMLGRPAACLELACEVLQEPVDSRKLYLLSGGTSLGKHKQCVRNISSILRLQTTATITTSSLCVKFGCPALKDYVASVHDEYKHRMMAKLTSSQQRHVDVTRPLFPAAVFYACAVKTNCRVDKNQLLQLTMSQPKEFASVVSSIEKLCEHALTTYVPSSSTEMRRHGRKRKLREADVSESTPQEMDNAVKGSNMASTPSNTRSLDHIKRLIQQHTKLAMASPQPTTPSPEPTLPVQEAKEAPCPASYADWKLKILAARSKAPVARSSSAE
ncbi:hypothetical protein H310_08388 [Aphanomyces invadans]|uniref:Origin recognition complex subunit 6 n=1 Tax=Aphanomyces invadans TaxID=157072 RepID=A0A024TXP0_9STRA|nr:hypothetical protein H310_08388 [Aphanomyces invadans]ETV98895.1 hypothetical protein H310_08388 [Aphanomyces invadans]|eukprot:XP_008872323.1 hypothetical protein H310_08388 [Aphanomyces invadans]